MIKTIIAALLALSVQHAHAGEAPATRGAKTDPAIEYFGCLRTAARINDDGKSDAATIALALTGMCVTEFNRWKMAMCGGVPRDVYLSCRRGIEDTEQGNIVAAVLMERRDNRRSPDLSPVPTGPSSGSGIVINTEGDVLTNSHVVESCDAVNVRLPSSTPLTAVLTARDQKNDLAVVRIKNTLSIAAVFREGASIRPGDSVVAMGFPLPGLLSTTANLSAGNVSALAGLGDDTRYLQISTPVQPGNSGGPLLDASGHLVGIVTSKLNAARIARFTGDIPQNVNFALKAEVARTFLDSKNISYRTLRSDQQLSPADVGDIGRVSTVYIKCEKEKAKAATPAPTAPAKKFNIQNGLPNN